MDEIKITQLEDQKE